MVPAAIGGPDTGDSRCLLHARFIEQARRTPGSIALQADGRSIRFGELDAASARVAAALRARGVRDGALVGLHAERTIPYFVALLGILRSNGAVVPLPPSYPEMRLREILSFARLDAIVDAAAEPLATGAADRVLRFEELEAGNPQPANTPGGDPDQAAFVLCSSGSTGKPKMIVRSHRSFFHRLEWTWRNHPYEPGEICCQKSHMTTTHATYELFEPLLRGVPVHVIPDETVRHLETFWDTIRAAGVTRLLIVPSLLQASLDMPGFVPPPLRVLVLMGEYVSPRLAGRTIAAFSASAGLYSIYGSTEASSTLVCDLRESYREGEDLPLGRPIDGDTRALVLGPTLDPVAAGESGLLHIAGPALYSGYLHDPALTASLTARSKDDGTPLFNTSDQVRRLADGAIQYVGRTDHTVKVRGFRVDLGEVERAMLGYPGATQAVVMLGGPADENPPLAAFYAPATLDQADIAAAVRDRLPVYMVPSVLVGMDDFPRTASGKIDRRRLLEDLQARMAARPARPPLAGTEERVAAAWRDTLRHGDIGADSNFFEIGGTSLTVFSVVSRLRTEFVLDRGQLSDHSIYEHPTVRGLSAHIDAMQRGDAPAAAAAAIAVTLRSGRSDLPPLFVIASSGGTLGAYDRLSRKLATDREVVGIRDPFVWGARSPTMGFQEWIALYVAAIRQRQPVGPYFVCAFSSAGAFGYEIAQHLRRTGADVAQLILIDPIGIAGEAKDDFGSRAFAALFRGRRSKWLVRASGWWRLVTGIGRRSAERVHTNDFRMSAAEFERRVAAVRSDRKVIKDLSSLFELNSGMPFTLTDADFIGQPPDEYVGTLLRRVKSVTPDVELETIERILVQYYCLQLPATHFYRLGAYAGRVEIFEPESPQVGLLSAYFRPCVRNLRMRVLPVGRPCERTQFVCENLSRSLRTHYRSMRDDTFVSGLAEALGQLLR